MKTLFPITLLFLFSIFLSACKKDEAVALDAGAINITNAVIGAPTLTLIANPSFVSATNQISANNFAFMPIYSGQTQVKVSVPAVIATATTVAMPEIVYYNQTLPVDNTTNYSLFLTGLSASAVDNVLIKETYTRTYADSVCGVRFINLALGNTPISVNIKTLANGSEAASIAYKAYSDFKQYPAKKANASYIFEFRNATTGVLITSYTLTTPYFHNVTLALRGTIGGSTGVILDNDY
jgi:hypothetical protein